MKIKICGLSRNEDIDYVNEARPEYIGFVFAKSKRQVSPVLAQFLRFRLANDITPVGVFVDSPMKEIVELYHKGIISIAQLHGNEDEAYIARLKELSAANGSFRQIKVIKTIKSEDLKKTIPPSIADFFLIDSGAGSGKTFNWDMLKKIKIDKPWFLAGGINLKNVEQAISLQTAGLKPYGIDVSSGVETSSPSGSFKDRKKILKLTSIVRQPDNIQIDYTRQSEKTRKKLSWSSK